MGACRAFTPPHSGKVSHLFPGGRGRGTWAGTGMSGGVMLSCVCFLSGTGRPTTSIPLNVTINRGNEKAVLL